MLPHQGKDVLDAYNVLLTDHADDFPELTRLLHLYLVLPAHTAEVERGFSTQNLIKTRLRSRLKVDNLDILMRVKLLGPAPSNLERFDYVTAVSLFNHGKRVPQRSSAGKTRPSYANKVKHSLTEDFDWEAE